MLFTNKIIPFFLVWFLTITVAASQGVRIDHVNILVNDIDDATEEYKNWGFTIKQGSLHKNGIINAHIKFDNKSSIELLSLMGEPKDNISSNYSKLLKYGEGGVYVALTGIPFARLGEKLNNMNIPYQRTNGRLWDYITFPDSSALSQFFFIDYHRDFQDSSHYYTHSNGSIKIKTIELYGDIEIAGIFEKLGLQNVNEGNLEYYTTTGIITLLTEENPHKFIIKSITLENAKGEVTHKISF